MPSPSSTTSSGVLASPQPAFQVMSREAASDTPSSVPSPSGPQLPEAYRQGLRQRMASGTLDLPLLPDVAMEVMNLSSSDKAGSQKIAEILHRDQTLAGHVLRIANSPLYRPRSPIGSLQQAISRLGINELRDIVYTVSVKSRLFNVKGYQQGVQALWQHAVSSAVYAKEIATMLGYGADKAFLWGLLHDVGKPVVLLTLAELQKELGGMLPLQAVVAAMDEMHTEVGGVLAERWQLPVIVQACIQYHHNYLGASEYIEAALVTSLADCLAHHLAEPETAPFTLESLAQHPALTHFRCAEDTLSILLGKRGSVLQAIQEINH